MTQKRELNLEPTDAIINALGAMLELLHTYGRRKGVPAKALALKLWPHSPGWTHNRKPGVKYRQQGKGPTYAATSLLVRMCRMNLAEPTEDNEGYRLTGAGLLQAIEKAKS